jgi:hypothetical protein
MCAFDPRSGVFAAATGPGPLDTIQHIPRRLLAAVCPPHVDVVVEVTKRVSSRYLPPSDYELVNPLPHDIRVLCIDWRADRHWLRADTYTSEQWQTVLKPNHKIRLKPDECINVVASAAVPAALAPRFSHAQPDIEGSVARFCAYCGAAREQETPGRDFCGACGIRYR